MPDGPGSNPPGGSTWPIKVPIYAFKQKRKGHPSNYGPCPGVSDGTLMGGCDGGE